MAWYDELGNAARMGGEFLLAAKAPAMYNALQESQNRARDQQEREAFMTKYIGQKEVPFNQSNMSMPGGGQRSIIQEPQQGSGQLAGQWSPMQSALEMMKATTPVNRTAGGNAYRDLLTAKAGQQRAPTFKTMGVPGMPEYRTNARYNTKTGGLDPVGEKWKTGAQNQIHIGAQKQYIKPGTQLIDEQGNKVKVPVGMTQTEARQRGYSYGDKQSAESIKSEAATGVSMEMLDELEGLYGDGGDITGVKGFLTDLRSGSDVWGVGANLFLNNADIPLSEKKARSISLSKSISNQLIQAMRGASVGPEEQKAFEKQLPVAGQPPELFMQNLQLTRSNLKSITDKKKSLERGVYADKEKIIMWDDM